VDLTSAKSGNVNKQENTYNNMINIGQNVQNLDELNDNANANINMEYRPAENQNPKGNENTKKDIVNDKYTKFQDEV